jgi:hypothetical protein
MLQDARIKEITLEIARANLGAQRVEDALVEPTFDSWGEDALRIIVVMPSADRHLSKGDDLIQFMMRLDERLEQEGEQRRAIPEFVTPEDLVEDLTADDQSEP